MDAIRHTELDKSVSKMAGKKIVLTAPLTEMILAFVRPNYWKYLREDTGDVPRESEVYDPRVEVPIQIEEHPTVSERVRGHSK